MRGDGYAAPGLSIDRAAATMGINGLLPVLKPICDRRSISSFAGLRVGVDASSWLHKGAFGCAAELCRDLPTRRYVEYCMHRTRMLLHYGVVPVLVFDGAPLPMKAVTNGRRREARAAARTRGMDALARGDLTAAEECFRRGVEVTHAMAREVIKEARKINVECVVAPYEADAQLAWLSAADDVDVVVTEDSDLVVYGAKKVFYKMNKTGDGELYQLKNLMALDAPNMRNFTPQMFTWVCVFSGCDFFDGVSGLGIHKAHKLVKRNRDIGRILRVVHHESKYKVAADFADRFHRACLVFRHQTVYDRVSKTARHLNAFDDEARAVVPDHIYRPSPDLPEDLHFIGTLHPPDIAADVSRALRHPVSLEPYSDPLDAVERPLPAAAAQPRALAPSGACAFFRVAGFQVNRARSASATPLFKSSAPPRKSRFFSPVSGTPSGHIGHSAAVGKRFKAPLRRTDGTSPVAPASAVETAGAAAPRDHAWASRSLSRLNPGNVARPARGKRSATTGTLGASGGKRQRTLPEMKVSATTSKAVSRFADASKRTREISRYGYSRSSISHGEDDADACLRPKTALEQESEAEPLHESEREPELGPQSEQLQEPEHEPLLELQPDQEQEPEQELDAARWSESKSKVHFKPDVELHEGRLEEEDVGEDSDEGLGECPSSPDSQAYKLFEAVDGNDQYPSESPVTPLTFLSAERMDAGGGSAAVVQGRSGPTAIFEGAADDKEKLPCFEHTLRRERVSISTGPPSASMMNQVRSCRTPRHSPEEPVGGASLSQYVGAGARGKRISRASL